MSLKHFLSINGYELVYGCEGAIFQGLLCLGCGLDYGHLKFHPTFFTHDSVPKKVLIMCIHLFCITEKPFMLLYNYFTNSLMNEH